MIGANGAGTTTLLRLACRELLPQRGVIRAPDHVLYCAQRTDDPPPELGAFLASWDGAAGAGRTFRLRQGGVGEGRRGR
ncbi:MAG TPA: hypothetical protein PKG50_01195 [Candidatus Bipolaricaulis anaerobius]|nr:hypothetical protein [Candidatus Bipolaricaulis anaerobius]HNS23882.1 hypothetical protein [Candidatus Bipolaricaulis anaerobius]